MRSGYHCVTPHRVQVATRLRCLMIAGAMAAGNPAWSVEAGDASARKPDGAAPANGVRPTPKENEEKKKDVAEEEQKSPWLAPPILSSGPKLGTAGGAIVGYIHY